MWMLDAGRARGWHRVRRRARVFAAGCARDDHGTIPGAHGRKAFS